MKIFKYELKKSGSNYTCELPLLHKMIRTDHVDDGFYKGDYLWAIVNPNHERVAQTINLQLGYSLKEKPDGWEEIHMQQIAVKEKQTVRLAGKPLYSQSENGLMYVYYHLDKNNESRDYTICVYKTGQEIKESLDKLEYLGINKLWIFQELALYTFLLKD
jgi:hypothetical protein